MIAPDARIPPIPGGKLCMLGAHLVRVYATIEVGAVWDGTYRCYKAGSGDLYRVVTRGELEVICG